MIDEAKVLEVLRQVEWVEHDYFRGELAYCPECRRWKSEGHGDDCKLDALLEDGQNEKAAARDYGGAVKVVEQGAVMVADLFELLEVLGVPEGTGLYVCDPTDPGKRFIIRRVGEGGKEPGPVGDYERAMEAVGVAARAAFLEWRAWMDGPLGGYWARQRMDELGRVLEVMDKGRLRFFKSAKRM